MKFFYILYVNDIDIDNLKNNMYVFFDVFIGLF